MRSLLLSSATCCCRTEEKPVHIPVACTFHIRVFCVSLSACLPQKHPTELTLQLYDFPRGTEFTRQGGQAAPTFLKILVNYPSQPQVQLANSAVTAFTEGFLQLVSICQPVREHSPNDNRTRTLPCVA